MVLADENNIQIKTKTIVGNLSQKVTNIDPQKQWYIYVAGITLFTFISGVIFIVRQNIKSKQYKRKYKR